MSDTDRKLRFFFAVVFMLGALTTILFATSIMTFMVQEGNLSSPPAPWQQGLLIILFIYSCLLVLFMIVFFVLATRYGILELRFQSHKLKQTPTHPPVPRHPVNQYTPQQQRRSGYRN
ncbi:MAG: hypothetical protein NVS4B12_14000 [Ktedonobacteraceae bacterium]